MWIHKGTDLSEHEPVRLENGHLKQRPRYQLQERCILVDGHRSLMTRRGSSISHRSSPPSGPVAVGPGTKTLGRKSSKTCWCGGMRVVFGKVQDKFANSISTANSAANTTKHDQTIPWLCTSVSPGASVRHETPSWRLSTEGRISSGCYMIYTLEDDPMDPIKTTGWYMEENTLPGCQDVRVYVSFRECNLLDPELFGGAFKGWNGWRGCWRGSSMFHTRIDERRLTRVGHPAHSLDEYQSSCLRPLDHDPLLNLLPSPDWCDLW